MSHIFSTGKNKKEKKRPPGRRSNKAALTVSQPDSGTFRQVSLGKELPDNVLSVNEQTNERLDSTVNKDDVSVVNQTTIIHVAERGTGRTQKSQDEDYLLGLVEAARAVGIHADGAQAQRATFLDSVATRSPSTRTRKIDSFFGTPTLENPQSPGPGSPAMSARRTGDDHDTGRQRPVRIRSDLGISPAPYIEALPRRSNDDNLAFLSATEGIPSKHVGVALPSIDTLRAPAPGDAVCTSATPFALQQVVKHCEKVTVNNTRRLDEISARLSDLLTAIAEALVEAQMLRESRAEPPLRTHAHLRQVGRVLSQEALPDVPSEEAPPPLPEDTDSSED